MLHDIPNLAGRPGVAASTGTTGLTSMLSVMLLLLAFFILLVSMVEFDARRTQAALGSLNATFAVPAADPLEAADGAGVGADGAIHRLAVDVGAALATLLRDGTFAVETEGALAVIRIDNDELFASGLTPSPALPAVAARLASLLAAPPARLRYEVEAVQPFGERGATRRAGVVVRALERAGIAPGMLMAGLLATQPGQTRLEIYATTVAEAAGHDEPLPRATLP